MGITELIMHSGPIGLVVLLLLLGFSLVSWAIIFYKWWSLRKAQKASANFIDLFWKVRRFDEVFERSKRLEDSPLSRVFQSGYQEWMKVNKTENAESASSISTHGVENVEHALRRASTSEMNELEKMVPFLATVGSTSPFIGLFGTVVGIMNSFHEIGSQGSASLATVAPGIAEALVATAAGLLAAIPAVMAYNYFSVRLRSIGSEMDTFSSDFLTVVKRYLP